jgi:hypothetical protein
MRRETFAQILVVFEERLVRGTAATFGEGCAFFETNAENGRCRGPLPHPLFSRRRLRRTRELFGALGGERE